MTKKKEGRRKSVVCVKCGEKFSDKPIAGLYSSRCRKCRPVYAAANLLGK